MHVLGLFMALSFSNPIPELAINLRPTIAEMSIEAGIDASGLGQVPRVEIVEKRAVVTVTAYSSTPDQTDDTPFITASGSIVRDGTVAANFLPFGTKVKIPEFSGDKEYIVEDRMHRRFSDRMDIWFETRELAQKFGKRELEIIIL